MSGSMNESCWYIEVSFVSIADSVQAYQSNCFFIFFDRLGSDKTPLLFLFWLRMAYPGFLMFHDSDQACLPVFFFHWFLL